MNNGEELTELQLELVGALVLLNRDKLEWIALLTDIKAPWNAKNKTDLARQVVQAIWRMSRGEG